MRRRLMWMTVVGLVLGSAGATAVGAIDPNLVGWWQLNDGSGAVAVESSGRSVDGTLFGDPVWSKDGVEGGCLVFDGANDYAFIDGGFKLPAYTIAVWFRDDVAGQRDIISAYAKGVLHGILLEVGSDGRLRFLNRFPLGTGGGNNIYSTQTFADGVWHHAAITKSATEIALYVDGQSLGTMADAGVFDPTDSFGIALGCLDNERALQRMWNGAMDDVRIYNRALSPDEIKTLIPPKVKAYKPIPPDGKIGVDVALFQWTKGDTAALHDLYLGTSPDLTAADLKVSRTPMTMYFHPAGLEPGTTYYWRVDEIEGDGVTVHTGNVWTFVSQGAAAYYPRPVDKANDAQIPVTLTWMPPAITVEHHLYFGDNPDAVTQAAAGTDKGVLTETTFATEGLDSLKTYYWRVDAIQAGGAVKTGPVWSFTTALTVDDFESYTDEDGSRIYQTWIDGWTNDTGATVGYEVGPFAEQKIVHGGKQSMPLDFNNVDAPFYSEAQREFKPAADWTAGGADTLILHLRGKSANASMPFYVAVEDASGKLGIVTHPDPEFVKTTKWLQWKIPFASFTASGVNPARVKKLIIGVGDKANPRAGGKGLIYIDDILLTRP